MEVTDADFEEKVIKASKKKVIVVDFWADWCVPCTMLGPVLEKAVASYKGKVVLAKINTDQNPEKADEYNITAIPAVKIFKNGEIVAEFIGVLPEEVIKANIDKALQ